MPAKTHNYYAGRFGLVVTPVEDLTIVRRSPGDGDEGGWTYYQEGQPVPVSRAKAIDALAIPPAWRSVRIASSDKAHIQAAGIDAKGRKQYLYHSRWKEVREAVKADRLLRFGRSLPAIRKQVEHDFRRDISHPRAVLATAVRLIDRQLVRVGSEQYLRDGTKGASTLGNADVIVSGANVALRYTGKSGREIEFDLEDAALKTRIRKLKNQNRGRLFKAGRGKHGKQRVRATMINRYLSGAAGRSVSAKDFRTFASSAMALSILCRNTEEGSEPSIPAVARKVSERLRNTPAVARSSYIHPTILTAFEKNALSDSLLKGRKRQGLSKEETALMRFLEEAVKG